VVSVGSSTGVMPVGTADAAMAAATMGYEQQASASCQPGQLEQQPGLASAEVLQAQQQQQLQLQYALQQQYMSGYGWTVAAMDGHRYRSICPLSAQLVS